ncbi:hypothetical protein Pint_02276 [Pistacia integerrima]|uniref:Uncharacterized protein n=1 Tax=Pistacia integerrima TaxID=434235 RepID=A0ACC0ZMR0_9ROSI|nr:hypothetical protein Pint_02276 [Pistacia integerrima]
MLGTVIFSWAFSCNRLHSLVGLVVTNLYGLLVVTNLYGLLVVYKSVKSTLVK